jgi:hypothetical protein
VAIGFSFTGKPLKDGFCHIVTYSSHVNLGFNRGALLPDPNRILQGKGKAIRHITINNQRELDNPVLRRYLQAAIEQISAQVSTRFSAGPAQPKPRKTSKTTLKAAPRTTTKRRQRSGKS